MTIKILFLTCLIFFYLQERLKKLKSEYGKLQLGNVTVDMVIYLCFSFGFPTIMKGSKLALLLLDKYDQLLCSPYVLNVKIIGGMRGIYGMLWETSLLDADEVMACSQ